MRRVHLEAAEDHVARLARENDPIGAIKELIWNSLDADATLISVEFTRAELGGVDRVVVTDNGAGIPAESCERAFDRIGGSWKASTTRTTNLGRAMHGSSGQGRLRGFALGRHIRWTTVADSTGSRRYRTVITANASARNDFDIEDALPTEDDTGTVFEAWGRQSERLDQLISSHASSKITTEIAPYLAAYQDIEVVYDGERIDPQAVIVRETDYEIGFAIENSHEQAQLRVIEWAMKTDRELHLCDLNGVTIDIMDVGIQAPGFNFAAYVSWGRMPEHQSEYLLGEGSDSPIGLLIASARARLREHFKERQKEQRQEVVNKWKADNVYPYDDEPATDAERLEQQTFDEVATTIHRQIPRNSARQQRVTLTLLRETIRHQPDNVHRLLDETFKLTEDDRAKIDGLLNRTSLSNIIKTNSEVAARFDFLTALSYMVFEPEVRRLVKERSQLHRILERETWIFGEHFQQLLSDRSLDAVLERHLEALGRENRCPSPVVREDGSVGIVDLMLSRANRQNGRRHHLIVELKAPQVVVGMKQLSQIQSYADAVAADPQFRDAETEWDFWLVTTNMNDTARRQARKRDFPVGCVHAYVEDGSEVRVWLRSWAEIIEECRDRLHFFRSHLDHDPDVEQALEYLNAAHPTAVIPDVLQRVPGQPSRAEAADNSS